MIHPVHAEAIRRAGRASCVWSYNIRGQKVQLMLTFRRASGRSMPQALFDFTAKKFVKSIVHSFNLVQENCENRLKWHNPGFDWI